MNFGGRGHTIGMVILVQKCPVLMATFVSGIPYIQTKILKRSPFELTRNDSLVGPGVRVLVSQPYIESALQLVDVGSGTCTVKHNRHACRRTTLRHAACDAAPNDHSLGVRS